MSGESEVAAERNPEIAQQMESLSKATANLDEHLKRLFNKINPILRCETEAGEAKDQPRKTPGSPLGEQIDHIEVQLQNMTRHVRTVISRVEV